MEKLRIKLNKDEATCMYYFFVQKLGDLEQKRFVLVSYIDDLCYRYLIEEVCNRLANITFKGGRLSINPAEAVTLLKLIFLIDLRLHDYFIRNTIQNLASSLHKYLTDLL